MRTTIHKAFLDGNLIVEQASAICQRDIRNICLEYGARLMGVVARQKRIYDDTSEVVQDITEYKFEKIVLPDEKGYGHGV